jgi:hypothetical protein
MPTERNDQQNCNQRLGETAAHYLSLVHQRFKVKPRITSADSQL